MVWILIIQNIPAMLYIAVTFYANEELVTSTQLEGLRRSFDVLFGLFDWVGLRMNTRKTVIMDCQPFHASGKMLVDFY